MCTVPLEPGPLVGQTGARKETRKRAERLINKLKGVKEDAHKSIGSQLADLPMAAVKELLGSLVGSAPAAPVKKDARTEFPKLFALSPGEREVLEAVERKAGKIGFQSKIRFIYVAKKAAMSKSHAVQPFIGSIKQMNTFHMQALRDNPECAAQEYE